jgi:hypothetical protein
MLDTPRWLKIARVVCLFGLPVMMINCLNDWTQDLDRWEQSFPTALLLVACTHLTLRAPYKKWSHWEAPFVLVSVLLAASGAFLFRPEGEAFQIGFQIFLGLFAFLAVMYGFFCTAIPSDHALRKTVIVPTKKVAHFGIVGFDIGLVLCPFAFAYYLVKALTKGDARSHGR